MFGSETQSLPRGNQVSPSNEWIAVVGMACRFPQADTLDEYWNILSEGRSTCSVAPSNRRCLVEMDPEIKANFLKCPIDEFDAGFFGLSPKECKFTDPQARLLLEVSWEAFENAGISPEALRGSRAGVFYGSWLQEYKEAMNDQRLQCSGKEILRKYLGNGFGCTAAKLSYFYGFTGPNISTESGCSSSMMAVHMAIKSLQSGECPLALACGSNIILHLGKQRKVWAEDGLSRVFDAKANGYARAEGIAVLLMKRYSDAIKDNDTIHAIIRGSASSQEGLSRSFGSPTVESEGRVMREALIAAEVLPSQVDYVEAHATGTWVGDPIEAAAIVQAYSTTVEEQRDKPLWIGSVKANIGHTESCSGLAGIIKVILAMKHETIPKHVNLIKQNPNVDFSSIPGAISLNAIPWPQGNFDSCPRIAGVSSFGITGTDVHMILQEPPLLARKAEATLSELQPHLLTISAKSKPALDQSIQHFCSHLETSHDSIEDITYAANLCRPHHPFRAAVVAIDKYEMAQKLKRKDMSISPCPVLGKYQPSKVSSLPKVCFTFPGRVGICDFGKIRTLYERYSFFKDTVDKCCALFETVAGRSPYVFSEQLEKSSDVDNLPCYSLFVICQYSLATLWMHWGLQPTSVLGHCMGEVTAAVISGALELEDAFKITHAFTVYGAQFRTSPRWKMLAVKTNLDAVSSLISALTLGEGKEKDNCIDVACVNSASQSVVIGEPRCVQQFEQLCSDKSILCKAVVPCEFPVHSRAVEQVCQELASTVFSQLRHCCPMTTPYISSATGDVVKNSDLNEMHWFRVFRHRINYQKACKTVQEENLGDMFIEMGLNGVLTKLTRENLSEDGNGIICITSLTGNGILTSVGKVYVTGLNINWQNVMGAQGQRVPLPGYPFQRKSIWFERAEHTPMPFPRKNTKLAAFDMVHPLLGVVIETPASFNHIVCFQNEWLSDLLDTKRELGYIRDHVIGSQVVLPGAALLEMIAFAWIHAQKNWNSNLSKSESCTVTIENFEIFSPLVLGVGQTPKRLQTVVNLNGLSVSVYSSSEGVGSQWTRHATAYPCDDDDASKEKVEKSVNIPVAKLIAESNQSGVDDTDFYSISISQVGLNFGNIFKCVNRMYKSPQSKDILFQVTLNDEEHKKKCAMMQNYICHPILLDAMMQAVLIPRVSRDKRLVVPVKIETLKMYLRTTGFNAECYVHYSLGSDVVSLLDANGDAVAVMEGFHMATPLTHHFVTTAASSKKFTSRCAQYKSDMLKLDTIVNQLREQYLLSKSDVEKTGLVSKFVVQMVCQTLNINENEIADHTQLSEMGMDSIMSIELSNGISKYLGKIVNGIGVDKEQRLLDDLEASITVSKLKEKVSTILVAK